jgi:hypothetical protein
MFRNVGGVWFEPLEQFPHNNSYAIEILEMGAGRSTVVLHCRQAVPQAFRQIPSAIWPMPIDRFNRLIQQVNERDVLDREVWRDFESPALSSLQNYCAPAYYRVT